MGDMTTPVTLFGSERMNRLNHLGITPYVFVEACRTLINHPDVIPSRLNLYFYATSSTTSTVMKREIFDKKLRLDEMSVETAAGIYGCFYKFSDWHDLIMMVNRATKLGCRSNTTFSWGETRSLVLFRNTLGIYGNLNLPYDFWIVKDDAHFQKMMKAAAKLVTQVSPQDFVVALNEAKKYGFGRDEVLFGGKVVVEQIIFSKKVTA